MERDLLSPSDEGTYAGAIGGTVVAGWFLILDLLQGHPLRTPSVLGQVLLFGRDTPDLAAVCATADILVAAVGKAGLIRKSFVKAGATVIDVGVNRVDDPKVVADLYPESHPRRRVFTSKGSLLVGDVHPEVAEVAGALTPVPGGVGPLTITMLMMNTLAAASARVGAR